MFTSIRLLVKELFNTLNFVSEYAIKIKKVEIIFLGQSFNADFEQEHCPATDIFFIIN